jgi:hypothetical protein
MKTKNWKLRWAQKIVEEHDVQKQKEQQALMLQEQECQKRKTTIAQFADAYVNKKKEDFKLDNEPLFSKGGNIADNTNNRDLFSKGK